ncbi:MAG: AraC family transcriptional regulator, partial [Flavobacterium sp.]
MNLGILLTQEHRLLSVAAMLDVFESVNRFYESDGETAPFNIKMVHLPQHEPAAYPGYPPIAANDMAVYDILFVPAFKQEWISESLKANLAWVPWLQSQYREGAAIASFCTGAFLLASTGLLDGKPATTHINAETAFAKAFPNVILQSEAVVTEKDRIFTSGGATNSFHLMMRVLEIYCSKEIAVRAAKVFSIDMDRNRQTYFGTFSPANDHGDDLVRQTQEGIKKNFNTANTIEEIIINVPASRRNLVRRFKQVTG